MLYTFLWLNDKLRVMSFSPAGSTRIQNPSGLWASKTVFLHSKGATFLFIRRGDTRRGIRGRGGDGGTVGDWFKD